MLVPLMFAIFRNIPSKASNARATAVIESQWRALERLSFQAVRKPLANFFARFEIAVNTETRPRMATVQVTLPPPIE